eukprot:scaffold92148_cov48-Phaeocystis_antarctica.AAC.4
MGTAPTLAPSLQMLDPPPDPPVDQCATTGCTLRSWRRSCCSHAAAVTPFVPPWLVSRPPSLPKGWLAGMWYALACALKSM